MATNSSSKALGFYGVLGLRPGATDTEIRTAFSAIANTQGADGGNSLTDASVALAFEVLGDATRRSLYDSVHGFSVPQGQGIPPAAASSTWEWLGGSAPTEVPALTEGHSVSDGVQMSAPPCLHSHSKQGKEPGAPCSEGAASIQRRSLLVLIFAVKSTCLICRKVNCLVT